MAFLVFQKAIERYKGLHTTANIWLNSNNSQEEDLFLRMVCIATQFQNVRLVIVPFHVLTNLGLVKATA